MPVPTNTHSKLNDGLLNKTCNTSQHLPPKGHYIEPKIYSGFQRQQIKLTPTKRQLCNPRIESPRRTQRDEISCRLSNEPSRQTTSFAQCQNFEPKKEDSFVEMTTLNWNNTQKTPIINDDPLHLPHYSSAEFGVGSGIDTPHKDLVSSHTKLYRSPSLFCSVPSPTLTKLGKSNELNIYNYNNYSQSPRYCLTKRNTNKQRQNVFRSSSIHAGESSFSWYPTYGYYGSKSTRI